jgi:glutathione-regulated potassium-efflux system ancillary protein KefG
MDNKILILFAHPRYEKSINNALLRKNIPALPGITVHDLYETYPDFNIDIEHEKALLNDHQIIIWQHPFYWYSAPSLLKQWTDLVLEFGWAYGPGGQALAGKIAFNVITAGGQRQAYQKDGYNRFTVRELLAPFEQTATLCKMIYLPPFALHGTHRISLEEAEHTGRLFGKMLLELTRIPVSHASEISRFPYLNDWITNKTDQ